jgi:hypothetical protein
MSLQKAKDRGVIMLGLLITMVSLGGAFALGDYTLPPGEGDEGEDEWVIASQEILLSNSVSEGASETEGADLDQTKVTEIVVTLTWTDEDAADARHSNTPDTLRLEVEFEFGNESGEDSGGRVVLTFTAPEDQPWDMDGRTISATVTAVNCGDQEPLVPDPLGFRTISDGGNDYDLNIEVKYKTKDKPEPTE